MLNFAEVRSVEESGTQIPVSWYFDPKIYELEQKLLFQQSPGYVGHELMVPNVGDYYTLAWGGDAEVLVRDRDGIELLSNICRHRQAIMLKGRGNARNIVCPLHRWTYNIEGKLIKAPLFPNNPCLNLDKTPLQNWNGLLFDTSRNVTLDLANLGVRKDFDFTGYVLDRVQIDDYPINWKTFIEVYLEDYHVAQFHPGLDNFVTCDDLKWEFGEWYCAKTVGVKNKLTKAGTPVYERWQQAVCNRYGDKMPPYGAIWVVYYPNIMLEWYPQTLVVSTLIPRSIELTTNVVEFYYPQEIALKERDYVEAQQTAFQETAVEDDEILRRMTEGKRALYLAGRNEVGPYQSPMEDGMKHFHEFVRRELEPHV